MKLLDQIRHVLRLKHYSYRTEQCYVAWIEQFLRFHRQGTLWRHPAEMGAAELEAFLTYLAAERHVSASTQNQALNAVVFLYTHVLRKPLGNFDALRAIRRRRVPAVLATGEMAQLLEAIDARSKTEPFGVMASLLYGAGLRLMECCRLRMKDVDLARGQLIVRAGKGDKDRLVMLPQRARDRLEQQMEWRRRLHATDLERGHGRVEMPDALAVKLAGADHELAWQFVFASRQLSRCPRSGRWGRHHAHEGSVQRAVTGAVRGLGWTKRVTCHTLRMASAYYSTFQRMAHFQGNSRWSGDVFCGRRPTRTALTAA